LKQGPPVRGGQTVPLTSCPSAGTEKHGSIVSTAVVTGAGFLGSHLCEYLLEQGHRVLCVDNLDTSTLQSIEHFRDADFLFINHDIVEHIEVVEPVDVVFHLASPASPIDYLRLPLQTLKVGSYGTHNALGLAKFKRARFLLASTSEVYGDPQIHPQPEGTRAT
jgi:dTDP-glucose 4,6-dehydratase